MGKQILLANKFIACLAKRENELIECTKILHLFDIANFPAFFKCVCDANDIPIVDSDSVWCVGKSVFISYVDAKP